MRLVHFVLTFMLGLLLVLATPILTPATQTAGLPVGLNTALCMNDWDKALNILQQMINTKTTTAATQQQLVALRSTVEDYRARNVRIDQSEACAAAILPAKPNQSISTHTTQGASSTAMLRKPQPSANCNASNLAADGKCLQNKVAKQRHNRSWEAGDRPASERTQR